MYTDLGLPCISIAGCTKCSWYTASSNWALCVLPSSTSVVPNGIVLMICTFWNLDLELKSMEVSCDFITNSAVTSSENLEAVGTSEHT